MILGVLVYMERDGHVLMINRQKKDEHYSLWLAPGGKVERNEAPYEAAVREVFEETGLTLHDAELKSVLTFPDDGDSPFGDEWTVFVFHSLCFSGQQTQDCPEGELSWVPRDELTELPMWEGDRLFTPKIFEPGNFTAKFHYKKEQLIESRFFKKSD